MCDDLCVIRDEAVYHSLSFNSDVFCHSRYLHLQKLKLSKLFIQ